jgi:hypothetical protein
MILTACIFLKHLIKLKKQIKKNFDTQFLQASNLLNTKFHLVGNILKKCLKVLIPMITKKTYYVHTL